MRMSFSRRYGRVDVGFSWGGAKTKLGDGRLIVQGQEKQTAFQVRDSTSNYLKSWSQGPPLRGEDKIEA